MSWRWFLLGLLALATGSAVVAGLVALQAFVAAVVIVIELGAGAA